MNIAYVPLNKAATYRHGKQCHVCGGNVRYSSNGGCVNCVRLRSRNRNRTDQKVRWKQLLEQAKSGKLQPESLTKIAAIEKAKGNNKFSSIDYPCHRCGGIVRYATLSLNCVDCHELYTQNHKRKTGYTTKGRIAKFKSQQPSPDGKTMIERSLYHRSLGAKTFETPDRPCRVCGCTTRYTNTSAQCINTSNHHQ